MSTVSRRDFLTILGVAAADPSLLPHSGTIVMGPRDQILSASPPDHPVAPPADPIVRGNARFHVLSPSLVRMEYSPSASFVNARSVTLGDEQQWPAPSFTAKDVDGWVEITTSKMAVRYKLNAGPFGPENLKVTWSDTGGTHNWKPGDTDDKNLGGVPGDASRPPHAEAYHTKSEIDPGPLSRNGYFWLDDSKTAVWNTAIQWPEPRPKLDGQDWYFFVYGLDYKHCLREATQLLGPVPMVPKYIFGTWFGSRAAYSGDEWKRIVLRFREEQIPLDMVVLDSPSTTSFLFAGLDWDYHQIPDRKEFFTWMKNNGVRATLNEHYGPLTPVNAQDDHHFDKIRTALGLPADTKEIGHDLANKKYAQLYMDLLHKPALDDGLAFWWQDGNSEARMEGLDGTMWTRHIEYEGTERFTGKRSFVFCRLGTPPWGASAGYPEVPTKPVWGSHRYGGYFSGDLGPLWSTLEFLSDFSVRSGNMLVPYVINLTAGVWEVSVDPELYQRWAQISALSPVFWWHGFWGMRLPWEYGEDGVNTVRRFLQLRYQLMPYTYTYARIAHETGVPLMRGTYIEYPAQEDAYKIPQQFLYGQDLLVAPIYAPGGGQPVTRSIYLPADEHWYDYFTGQIYEGGQTIHYQCPLERMPLFVRAGAIIPMAPNSDFTGQRPNDPLTISVFAGKFGSFRLYEDDGESLEFRKKQYAWTPMQYESNDRDGQHTIRIDPSEGRYAGQPSTRRYRILVHGLLMPSRVTVGGRALTKRWADEQGSGWTWDPITGVTKIDLIEPISVRDSITVALHGSGRFADAAAAQQIRQYRERVRSIKPAAKFRWGAMLGWDCVKAEPHILVEVETVEQQLIDLLAHPEGLAMRPVDYKTMTTGILSAMINSPFVAQKRTVPELDPEAIKSTKAMENGKFLTEERRQLVASLLDCKLITTMEGSQKVIRSTIPVIRACLQYDTASIEPPLVEYDLIFPHSTGPGWFEITRNTTAEWMEFTVNPPMPLPAGIHFITVRATVTWPRAQAQTIVESLVPWVATPV